MAQSWEWNPEASAMDTGFRLDELLRGERAANARQAQSLGATAQQVNQQHQNKLAEMLYGDQLKTQAADREAERAAPFLRSMISGNPQVAKSFGFGQDVTTPGELPVPEAGYAGTPATTSFQSRQPTMAEVSGLAKAVPGITQALLQKSMDPNSQFTLGPGQKRFDAQGNEIAQGGALPSEGMTQEQAERVQADMIARNPNLRGRVTIQQNDKGAWTVKQTPSEPLTESPNVWISQLNSPSTPPEARAQAKRNLDVYNAEQERLAKMRVAVQPMDATRAGMLEKQNEGIQAAYSLLQFTPQERETYTGAGRVGFEAAAHAAELGLPTEKFGYSPEQLQRFQDFKRWNGMIEQFKFALGGKQLTGPEQKVVEAFIPTGRERTTSEYEAKLRGVAGAMQAAQDVDMYLAQTGKGFVSPEEMHSLYVAALRRHGIDVTAKATDAQRDHLSSGQRLRQDFSK